MEADIVIFNGAVHTLDAAGTEASAVALAGGKIVAVGDDATISELRTPSTEVIDARGRAVLPAFIDSHTHLRRATLVGPYYLDFMTLAPRTIADVLDSIRRRVATTPPGDWIEGDSLMPTSLVEHRFPNRAELDAVAPQNPVLVRGIGVHVLAANSLALQAADIDADTPDPAGGRLERDSAGELNGVLHERGKLRLDASRADTVVPMPSDRIRLDAMADMARKLNTVGISCVHDMAREPIDISDYLQVREADRMTVRVRLYIRGIESQTELKYILGLGLRTGFGDEWVRLGGVKFSIDGSAHGYNAAIYEDYPGQPGNRGLIRIEPDELLAAVRASHRAGLQVAVHAIGQRAVDIALDTFETVQHEHPVPRLHHRIEHAYLPPRPGQLERIVAAGLIWSVQPAFLYDDGDDFCDMFGADAHRAMPLETMRRLGAVIQINSDYPCTPVNPFNGIHAAVTRLTRNGNVIGASEAITVDQALRYATTAAGYSTSGNGMQGRIEAGCLGDVIITDQDPYIVDSKELKDIRVLLTTVGGEVVHRVE